MPELCSEGLIEKPDNFLLSIKKSAPGSNKRAPVTLRILTACLGNESSACKENEQGDCGGLKNDSPIVPYSIANRVLSAPEQ